MAGAHLGPFGTKAAPRKIPSVFDSRVVGCTCGSYHLDWNGGVCVCGGGGGGGGGGGHPSVGRSCRAVVGYGHLNRSPLVCPSQAKKF